MAWGSGKWSLGKALRNLVSQPEITEQTWEDLEDTLLGLILVPTSPMLSCPLFERRWTGLEQPSPMTFRPS
jgi:hypothetical protein